MKDFNMVEFEGKAFEYYNDYADSVIYRQNVKTKTLNDDGTIKIVCDDFTLIFNKKKNELKLLECDYKTSLGVAHRYEEIIKVFWFKNENNVVYKSISNKDYKELAASRKYLKQCDRNYVEYNNIDYSRGGKG